MWLFVLCGLVSFTGKAVSSSCPIQLSPPTVVVKFGDPIFANCSSSSDQIDVMGWESEYGGTGVKEGVSSVALDVKSMQAWEITAQCFVGFSDGTQCSEFLPVTVYKTPDSVSVSQPSQPGPVVEGENYSMQCDIVHVAPVKNLSVVWHKGNEILCDETFDEPSVFPVNKSSVLKRVAHRDDNGSPIWCEAKMNFWPKVPNLPTLHSKAQEVIVLYPPTFTEPAHETLELPSRGKIILNCTATGNPAPEYSWHYPHAIQQTIKNQNENQPILTPSIQLPGTYNCTASNAQGTRTKYFTVVEATRNRTTLAALVGGFVALGALLFIGGLFFVTPEGTFSFSRGSYLPTSTGPV